jgi:hypothetical protein
MTSLHSSFYGEIAGIEDHTTYSNVFDGSMAINNSTRSVDGRDLSQMFMFHDQNATILPTMFSSVVSPVPQQQQLPVSTSNKLL